MALIWCAFLEHIPGAKVYDNERRSKVPIMVLGYVMYV